MEEKKGAKMKNNGSDFRKWKLGTALVISALVFLSGHSFAQSAGPNITLRALYKFDMKGNSSTGDLNQPAGIAIDGRGNLYVADTVNSRVVVFDGAGEAASVFGKFGEGNGELNAPMALAVDTKRGLVYVADSSNYRVAVFKTTGEFLFNMDLNKNAAPGEKKIRPIGIAVNSAGDLYVSDADNHQIRVYSPQGAQLFKFGGPGAEEGKFYIPVGLFMDERDHLYVVDMNNSRLQVFDRKGAFLFKLGEAGDTKGSFFKPKAVCVDREGYIYVSDAGNLVVQVFDSKGKFVEVIGAEQDANLQFASPFGLAAARGNLFVTDRWKNSVRVFEILRITQEEPTIE